MSNTPHRSRSTSRLVAGLVAAAAMAGGTQITVGVAAGASAPSTAGTTAPKGTKVVGYRDPSKNILCGLRGSAVSCTIGRQKGTSGCKKTYTAAGRVAASGAAVLDVGCFLGSPFRATSYKVVRYGRTFTRKGVTCRMARSGVTCTAKSKHGFKLLRSGSTTF